MSRYSLNEVLKAKEAHEQKKFDTGEIKLDDVTRVKILSPGRQVFKRFIRNRLAIVGSIILITMFVFCFIGPIFYAYSQDDTFYTYKAMDVKYAQAKENINYNGYVVDSSVEFDISHTNMANSAIKAMVEKDAKESLQVSQYGMTYIHKLEDGIYSLEEADATEICTIGGAYAVVGYYDAVAKTFTYADDVEEISGLQNAVNKNIGKNSSSGSFDHRQTTYFYEKEVGKTFKITYYNEGITYASGVKMDEKFENSLTKAAESGDNFVYRGKTYLLVLVNARKNIYTVYEFKGSKLGMVYSIFTFDPYETGKTVSSEFKSAAMMAAYSGGTFSAGGVNYTITPEGEGWKVCLEDGTEFGEFGSMSIRRFSGSDSMDYQLKKDISNAIADMNERGEKVAHVKALLPQQQEDGKYEIDENGNLQYVDSDLIITREDSGYVITCEQIKYVLNTHADPTADHILGTDGYGMDVFARIMYGGRVSLMVGFVVIIIETILGVIMGGIAGYFGSWVDTIIMRLVDIFYCLPSLPIMIIIGAMMDAAHLEPVTRLMIMMAALGVMGWAGVARLVRGQILSLREQEFMVATEATGMKVRVRIFRHLVPNVMPQLIVTATMGLGSVILMESTLSFLGLGVKHPYATWGTMINSVSTASAMAHYAYIWIPIGLLICLTVIAFNFVGDGLRDAYDPRAKR